MTSGEAVNDLGQYTFLVYIEKREGGRSKEHENPLTSFMDGPKDRTKLKIELPNSDLVAIEWERKSMFFNIRANDTVFSVRM